MSLLERIYCPVTPNFVKHNSFKAWCQADQLPICWSRMMAVGVGDDAVSIVMRMYFTLTNCQELDQNSE